MAAIETIVICKVEGREMIQVFPSNRGEYVRDGEIGENCRFIREVMQ